jgi:predicted RNA-binding Zn-ribbon protein involved in translation (DUF1610 family)
VTKRSRFYCENCGAEVKANAKVCPTCGRFFSAVRCPVCGFTGESSLFLQGCPSCGYAGAVGGGSSGSGKGKSGQGSGVSGFEVYDVSSISGREPLRKGRGAPPWIYWLTMALLGLFFVVMVFVYVRL